MIEFTHANMLLLPLVLLSALSSPIYPAVWGGSAAAHHGTSTVGHCSGHLFAFSGLDGPTNEEDPMVAIASDNSSLSLLFCSLLYVTPNRVLDISGAGLRESVEVASSDVVIVPAGGDGLGGDGHPKQTNDGRQTTPRLQMAWASRYLLAGASAPDVSVTLRGAKIAAKAPNCTSVSYGLEVLSLCTASTIPGGSGGGGGGGRRPVGDGRA